MAFPSFFSEIQPLVVHDRLAEFLGAADGGVIEYRYADAVKLAGHSCPTVAGTWLLTCRALTALQARCSARDHAGQGKAFRSGTPGANGR